jgi:hypothetical protein
MKNACAQRDHLFHLFVEDPSIVIRTSCPKFKIFCLQYT